MEDGPAKRTRSVTNVTGGESETSTFLSELDKEVFKTPTNSPYKTRKSQDRARTPSGQALSTSVKDIRNFFIQENNSSTPKQLNSQPRKVGEEELPDRNGDQDRTRITTVKPSVSLNCQINNTQRGEQVKGISRPKQSIVSDVRIDKTTKVRRSKRFIAPATIGANLASPMFKRQETKGSISEKIQLCELADQIEVSRNQNTKMNHSVDEAIESAKEIVHQRETERIYRKKWDEQLQKSKEELRVEIAKETELAKNQQGKKGEENGDSEECAVDIQVVYGMFRDLKKDITEARIAEGEDRLTNIETRQDQIMDTLMEMQEQMIESKVKAEILTGTVSHLSQVIEDMGDKIEKIELNNMKRSAVLSGYDGSRKKDVCIRQVEELISQEIGVEAEIEDVFFLNKDNPSPVVIMFSSLITKMDVMANSKNLKGLVNEEGKPFFISHYLPVQINERKRRENAIMKENENAEEEAKLEMTKVNGRLHINNVQYQKKLTVPTVSQILSLSKGDFNTVMTTSLKKGQAIKEKKNTFTGYTMAASCVDDVKKAYFKIKMLQASARHITCAYRVLGVNPHETDDYCDDNDHGCGRAVLDWMQKNKIECRAIFVVRTAGEKLDQLRFKKYTEAAYQAVMADPMNSINQRNQAAALLRSPPAPERIVDPNRQQQKRQYYQRISQSDKRTNITRCRNFQLRGGQRRKQR